MHAFNQIVITQQTLVSADLTKMSWQMTPALLSQAYQTELKVLERAGLGVSLFAKNYLFIQGWVTPVSRFFTFKIRPLA